jgi:hypothetical protein
LDEGDGGAEGRIEDDRRGIVGLEGVGLRDSDFEQAAAGLEQVDGGAFGGEGGGGFADGFGDGFRCGIDGIGER